jgi:hypothetical protein
MDTDAADATLGAAVPANLERYQFPMKAGAVDASRRLARVNLVWVRRADSALDWNGRSLVGAMPEKTTVGTRMGLAVSSQPLQAMGFRVDDSALSTRQLLAKLAAERVDLAVALQEEVEFAIQHETAKPLVVMPKAFSSNDFYTLVRPKQPPEMQEKIEAWWTAIGKLRELPEYRNR